uniref:Pseudouridine synthase RsuA/RluA-like domain-containing protein n=1 Tax=Coccolithus braarudii TaxID=221442 RepID=A0A7S0LE44_9EUKA|mmetsp:Transcript_32201/g.69209  ORF Transcript_32201/g.69209 Transcript_32201/m.69209 type:complete len:396 (+) Transcript_32201:24-1211(+)
MREVEEARGERRETRAGRGETRGESREVTIPGDTDAEPAPAACADEPCVVHTPMGERFVSYDEGHTYVVANVPVGACYTAAASYPLPREGVRVLHEDEAVIVVDKPAYLPTENTRDIKDSVRSRLEAMLGAREEAHIDLRMPHRLDWETSGVLVVARGAKAMKALAMQFAERSVGKTYVADLLGVGPPASRGVIEMPISADMERLPLQRVDYRSGRAARTMWQLIDQLPAEDAACCRRTAAEGETAAETVNETEGGSRGTACCRRAARAWRVRLRPETGRRHQLRVHMLALGAPIAHDPLYDRAVRGSQGGTAGGAARGGVREGGVGDEASGEGEFAAGGCTWEDDLLCKSCGSRVQPPVDTRLHLHAAELSFIHPLTGQQMHFRSEPPFDLKAC